MSRWFGGKALAIIFVTVLLDMMGIGIILPVLPSLIANLAGEGISNASMIGGWLFMAYSATQFLCGPMIGNLSDAYGRRPVLLLSILGLGVDYLVTAFAPTIGWLFVGRLLAGLCGASYTTASAYVADVTAPQDRAKAFGMLGAAFGIGFVLGPALGGLLGHFGPRTPFFFASGCSILNFAVAIFVLPESLGRDRRRPFAWRRANPLGAVLSLRRHPLLIRWALAIFLSFVAMAVYPAVLAFATIERYGWDATQIGLSLAFFGIVSALFQGGVVGPAIRVMGERRAALAGLIVAALTAVGFAFATEGWMIYVLIGLGGFQGVAMPAVNALMSHEVEADAQGELQGAVASLQALGSVFGPPMMTEIFAMFTGGGARVQFPGAPFLVAAVLFLLATVLLPRHGRLDRP
ncbi:TCR/Tet family MFS transporter [Lichenifustis flavocetrariae]|uniref:TCR/Tet family MFS transporter n=1 Tax=Lichenifustis flavocetrariae TaxID=2949735 RepID=A0AA42CMA8_9HYPH|nr:TCR/Tet family MFS transporter [Lichenifustis flavocetrariae]MCW6508165.1 TCR/Tet family MFS transporter [Lichenifustis flavocetrariae]